MLTSQVEQVFYVKDERDPNWAYAVRNNFKNLVRKGDQIIDKPYVLTFQVEQVFYVEDERDPDWACTIDECCLVLN